MTVHLLAVCLRYGGEWQTDKRCGRGVETYYPVVVVLDAFYMMNAGLRVVEASRPKLSMSACRDS
jgi:hypothetical protein